MAKLKSKKNTELINLIGLDIAVNIDGEKSTNEIKLSQSKNVFFLSINGVVKPIYKQEYIDILDKIEPETKPYTINFKNEKDFDAFNKTYFINRESDQLSLVGISLYGSVWKTAIAIALNVDFRRITHWLQCTRPIPKGVWADLTTIANQRQEEISDSLKLLKSKK